MKTTRKSARLGREFVVLALWAGCAAGTLAGLAQTAEPAPAKPASAIPVENAAKLNDRQKALADQADKLVAMATELKNQVDRTNKNILSVKVVQKAEEIERYARQIKDQAKK